MKNKPIVFGVILLFAMSVSVFAMTPQIGEKIIWGAETFAIAQRPLEPIMNQKVELGKKLTLSSSNHKGYQAEWLISKGKLYLVSFKANKRDGAGVSIQEVIPKARFPHHAKWFSGKLHFNLGDTNFIDNEHVWEAAIVFEIEKGIVKKFLMKKNVSTVYTWNGLPRKEDKTESRK